MNEVTTQSTQPIRGENEFGIMDLSLIKARIDGVSKLMRDVMEKDVHYGAVPGTKKPTLLKPGAELLGILFNLAPSYSIDIKDLPLGHREYVVRCTVANKHTGESWAEGSGSCSTLESKYRWRRADRACPQCGKETIRKSKDGGWYCWKKLDGCGATFSEDDQRIIGQECGKVENQDIADTYNTVLKMAQKRAQVAAILSATGCSHIFTQDVEDFPESQQRQQEQPPKPSPSEIKSRIVDAAREAGLSDEAITHELGTEEWDSADAVAYKRLKDQTEKVKQVKGFR